MLYGNAQFSTQQKATHNTQKILQDLNVTKYKLAPNLTLAKCIQTIRKRKEAKGILGKGYTVQSHTLKNHGYACV
jgi:hypothetical protein